MSAYYSLKVVRIFSFAQLSNKNGGVKYLYTANYIVDELTVDFLSKNHFTNMLASIGYSSLCST